MGPSVAHLEPIVGGIFAITFTITRIIYGPYYSYEVWKLLIENRQQLTWYCILYYISANSILNILNFYWYREILSNVIDFFFPSKLKVPSSAKVN